MKAQNKTQRHSLLTLWTAFILAQAAFVYAYPPDNAAVLYYKAMVIYAPDEAAAKMITDFGKGGVEPNDKIREFVDQNRAVVKLIVDAGAIEKCDWGLDPSEGLAMRLPHLGRMRSLTWLLAADARLLADSGNWPQVINECMSAYRMARHANDPILISYLVADAIHRQVNDGVIEMLGQMPQNTENLNLLKTRLAAIDSIPFSIKPALESERSMALSELVRKPEDAVYLLEMSGLKDESFKKKIHAFDQTMLERNIEYCRDYMSGVIAAFDMPYSEGFDAIAKLTEKAKTDAKNKPEATLAAAVVSTFASKDNIWPPYSIMLSRMVLQHTQDNAIRNAIEIYLTKAQTGSLPEALPAGLGGDLFSGKPFVYEQTAEGFVLSCQGKDLTSGEIHKYRFNVK